MRRLARAVGNKFDSEQQAAPANLADPRIVGELCFECRAQLGASRCRGFDQVLVAQNLQHGARNGGSRNRVAIGEAVDEAARQDRLSDVARCGNKAERPVATRHALCGEQQVWLHVPVVRPEPGSRSPEAGHHLVGNEEHLIARAPGAHYGPIVVGWDGGGERCTNDRLGNKGGDAPWADTAE